MNCFVGISQNGIRGVYYWPEYEVVTIPDSLSEESAVYISNVTNIDFLESSQTKIRIFKRLYINSEEAAEKFSKREFILQDDGKIKMLQARSIKSDGTIIPLVDSDVIDTYSKSSNRYGGGSIRRIQLIYPDVKVGDVIDLAYEIHYDRYLLSRIMRLEDDMVSLYSRATIRNLSLMDVTVYSLNGMPEMISKTINSVRTVTFEKKGVGIITDGFFDVPRPKSPQFIYTLWYPHQSLDYNTFYDYDANKYPYDYRKTTSLKTELLTEGVYNESDLYMVRLKKFVAYLEKYFSWVDVGNLPNTAVQSTQNYYEKQMVNQILFSRYVLKFLNDNSIPFNKGFTKNLRDGQFIQGTVLLEQMSERFFIVYDETNQAHYLFPPSGKDEYYFLDEIPFYVEGNDCVGLDGLRDKFEEEYPLTLPDSELEFNQHRSIINVEIGADSCIVSRRDKTKGHYSFLTRSGEDANDWLEELSIIQKTKSLNPISVDGLFPYEAIFEQDSLKYDLFTQIDDSLSWMNLKELLPGGIYVEDEVTEEYGDYVMLPFLKKSDFSIFIKSKNGISLEETNTEFNFKNEVGSIDIKVTGINANLIKVKMKVSVEQKYLLDDNVDQYEALIKNYADFVSKKWVVKTP